VTAERPWLNLLRDLYVAPSPEESRRQNEAYGRLLVDLGLATREQIDRCLASPADPAKPFPKLSRLLIDRGVLSPAQLSGSVVAHAAEDPDNRIGPYVLVGNLRGDTWKAWDTVRHDWAELTFVSPSEARALEQRAAVAHPALAALRELTITGERTYVVFEAVSGVRLSAAPRNDPRRLLGAIRDAAEGVDALHARDLVHGGITLESVTLDAEGRGRLTGWGAGSGDVRALAAGLFEVLTDRAAPAEGTPKTWPKRLGPELRALLARAMSDPRVPARAFADGLSAVLKNS
jgi:hypothetical protein